MFICHAPFSSQPPRSPHTLKTATDRLPKTEATDSTDSTDSTDHHPERSIASRKNLRHNRRSRWTCFGRNCQRISKVNLPGRFGKSRR